MSTAGRDRFLGWLSAGAPVVGVEIAPRRVAAAAVTRQRGGAATIDAHAVEPLPADAVAPSLNAVNISRRDVVASALARVLDRVGRPQRVALVVPDTAAKVSLVRFEKVPSRQADLDAMIRWHVRKAAPFPIEQAQVAWTDGIDLADGGREFVVVTMRRDVVQEYEAACTACGAHAGIVDLATFNLVNVALMSANGRSGAPSSDWLLVHLTAEYSTLAIVRGSRLVFYRNRLADSEGHLADLVHQTAMYYEDRLGGGQFSRVVVTGGAAYSRELGSLRDTLEGRLHSPVEILDVRRAATFTDRIEAPPDVLAALAAPVGLVLREA